MRNYIILILTNLFILPFGQLIAQDYTVDVQTYGIEEGLLHREVQTVFEDKNGFLWIGGFKGLQRFDGHDFKTWTKADRTGLIYYISTIGQDDEGWLWLWNNDLLQFVFLHPETEVILTEEERFGNDFPIFVEQGNLKTWNNQQCSIPTNRKGQLFFSTKDGRIISYDSQTGFQFQKIENNLSIQLEFCDNQDNIWVFSRDNGLFKINSEGKILNTYPIEKDMEAGNYSFWNEEFYFLQSYYSEPGPEPSPAKIMKVDAAGNLHFVRNSKTGWYVFDGNFWNNNPKVGWEIYDISQTKILHTLKKEDYPIALFETSYIPYQDSRGNFWIYGNYGLCKVKFQKSRFRKYFAFDNENDKPFYNAARGIWVEEDTIFTNFEKSATVRINRKNRNDWQVLNTENWARPLIRKENGDLWIGYPFFIESVTSTGKSIQKVAPKEGQAISGIWSFYEDDYGKLLIGSGDELFFKDKQASFLRLYEPAEDPFGFKARRGAIQSIIGDEGNLVWFCSWTGLYLFDTKSEKILARYASDEKDEFYLPANLFYFLYKDKEGIYWIGTSEGLIRWTGDGGRWTETGNRELTTGNRLFTRKDGLSNDVIYAIFEDNHNRLWMSSDHGIMSIDKETFDVKTYLEKDGISHHEFNRTSQFQTEDGTIYFGGLNGITAFHPDDFITEAKDYPQLLISDYEIFDGEEEKLLNKVGELRQTKTINFHPNDRFFRLKFVLPTFEDISQILYAWKVEGVDSDWNYQKENNIQIGVLPHGNHILRIKGQSGGGGWSPHELAIQVNVIKPFYLQLWFILLSVLTLILGVYLFFKRRTRLLKQTQKLLETEIEKATSKIEAQAEELRETDKIKSRFFANVSHELRTPITLIQGPIQSALNSQKLDNRNFTLLYKAKENTKKLLRLVNEILDLTKLDAHKLELDETTVVFYTFLRRILSNFESHAASKAIDLVFNYDPSRELQIKLDIHKFEKILTNLLTNAFKFTPNSGQINIKVEDLGKDLRLIVKDTGRGIPPKDLSQIFNRFYQSSINKKAEGGLGIGLALSMEYIKLMNGKMWAESNTEGENRGSTFFVQFPKNELISMLSTEDAIALKGENEKSSNPKLSNENGASALHEHTILLVEDNPDLREYISFLLSPYYNVLMAENGKEGMERLTVDNGQLMEKTTNVDHLPSLIISDIMMPIMDGYEFLENVKKQDQFRHIPVIMLTARAELRDRLKALRIGVDDYLLKPFDEEELLTRIENLMLNYQERINMNGYDKAEASDTSVVPPKISKEDEDWLKELEEKLTENLSNTQYSIPQLAYDLAISERQLRRRIKQLTGLSTLHYFKEIRLQKARQLLEERQYKTIAQTASAVGFQNAKTFSRNFSQRFGKMPSDYLNS